MRISQVTLKNFRCFGGEPVSIALDELTALIGTNGSGKTAALIALARLFSVTQADRRLQPEDFHTPPNADRNTIDQIDLIIEARLEFPELTAADDTGAAVPPCFNQMMLGEGNNGLFCRVRLEGTWTRSSLPDGDIEEKAYWITTDSDDVTEEDKRPMQAYERSLIHVLYVPAYRDATKQLAQASGSLVYRLFHAIEWGEDVKRAVKDTAEALRESVCDEDSMLCLHACIGKAWRKLHDMPAFKNVAFQPISNSLEELLKRIEVVFSPGDGGREHSIDRLSEGLKSLFYFSLVASVFEIEEAIKAKQLTAATASASETDPQADTTEQDITPDPLASFSAERLRPPALTVFAIEEPENHLAPHYLGRIIELLQTIADSDSGQVVLTSHSPAIMSRIDPQQVRYLRLENTSLETRVRNIELPAVTDEAFKYVKEAVRAYPELYFARLVVLGEGDSEEIVIPRVARASGIAIDTNLISVVPLGGRHVNHFWKLLRSLDIPHLTLLDFDRERLGGGWGRIHYACAELIKLGVPRKELLAIDDGNGGTELMDDVAFNAMGEWDPSDETNLSGWRSALERFGVYFAAPLDLDFLMLRAFPVAYHAAGGGQPQIPQDSTGHAKRVKRAVAAVLKDGGGDGTARAAFFEAQGIDTDDPRTLDHDIRFTRYCEVLKQEVEDTPADETVVKQLLCRIMSFIGAEMFRNHNSQYRRGDFYEETLTNCAQRLTEARTTASNWLEAVDILEGKDSVPIMTIHKSKGLEYHSIVFVGLEDSALWGFRRAPQEETCAFFVAFSRAIARVVFTFSEMRPDRRSNTIQGQSHTQIDSLYELLQQAGVTANRYVPAGSD